MIIAKLNDGRCVVMLKQNQSVSFDSDRRDWCLCYSNAGKSKNIDCNPRKRYLFWIKSTQISKLFEFKDIKCQTNNKP